MVSGLSSSGVLGAATGAFISSKDRCDMINANICTVCVSTRAYLAEPHIVRKQPSFDLALLTLPHPVDTLHLVRKKTADKPGDMRLAHFHFADHGDHPRQHRLELFVSLTGRDLAAFQRCAGCRGTRRATCAHGWICTS